MDPLALRARAQKNPANGEHREQQGERSPPDGPPLHVDAMTGSEPPDQRRDRDAHGEGDGSRPNADNDDGCRRSVAQLRHRGESRRAGILSMVAAMVPLMALASGSGRRQVPLPP